MIMALTPSSTGAPAVPTALAYQRAASEPTPLCHQEKNLPHRLNAALVSAFSPPLFERAVFPLRPSNLVSSPRVKHTSPPPCGFFPFRDGLCPSFSETTSLTVSHCLSGTA